MKKLLIIGGIIVAIFIAIIVLSNKSDEAKLKDNPYGTDQLHKSTIALIGNENYSNIALPDEVFSKIESGEPTVVYYFHPECQYCMQMTPVMMPIAKEMSVDVLQYNMLEFGDDAFKKFGIDAWPALVYYKDGKEVIKTVGAQPEENIRAFFTEVQQ